MTSSSAAELLNDLAALADVAGRSEAARALARRLAADDLIVFVDDSELGIALPALGFPKTIPDGHAWQTFIADARAAQAAQAAQAASQPSARALARELPCPFTGATKWARAFARTEAVLVLIGSDDGADMPTDHVEQLFASLPLLGALFRAERTTLTDRAQAEIARQSAQRAEALAANLAVSQADLHRAMRDLHESREWLSTTLSSIGDAVMTTDAQARVTFMNGVAEDLTRWSRSEAEGRPLSEVFHVINESTRAIVPSPVDEALRAGAVVALANHTVLVRRDGSEVPIDDSAAPIRDARGVVAGAVLIFRDITGRRMVDRARTQLVEELQRVLRGNELFAAILGHDLRNPLGAIMMSAELLSRTQQDQRTQTVVERIMRSGSRMQRMIDQLLDFTRARHGEGLTVVCRDGVDLAEVTEHVVAELAVAHPERPLFIAKQGDVRGCFDADRISQVMSNLVGNAIKHGDAAAGVRIRIDGEGKDEVIVEVHNQGAIAHDMLPSIFDPFRSGRSQRDQSTDGLGLGLFITKEIVRAHRGDVEVSSSPSDGTTFRVRLPRREASAPSAGH